MKKIPVTHKELYQLTYEELREYQLLAHGLIHFINDYILKYRSDDQKS